MKYGEQAAAIVAACRRLHLRGLLAGTEGNVSVRISAHTMLITPSGADKGTLQPEQILEQPLVLGSDYHKSMLDVTSGAGFRDSAARPSSEIEMHRVCYAARPDVCAVVHAHPPVATGLATAGKNLPANIVPELPVVVGPIALVSYARPGTPTLGAAMQPLLNGHEVFLLSNHGVTSVGQSLEEAVQRMESTEQAARIYFVAQVMGGAGLLPQTEVDHLLALHPRSAAHLNHPR
ncbi:MAG: class II aldolase/adducin family protein [Gemmatimonadaceae bacterium]